MKRNKKKNKTLKYLFAIIIIIIGVFFTSQQFSLLDVILQEEKIIYDDYKTLEFDDSNNNYCDGNNLEFDLITQKIDVTENNYIFNLNTNERPIAMCDMNLDNQKYDYLGNNKIEITKSGDKYSTIVKSMSLIQAKTKICSNTEFTTTSLDEFGIFKDSIIFGINSIILDEEQIDMKVTGYPDGGYTAKLIEIENIVIRQIAPYKDCPIELPYTESIGARNNTIDVIIKMINFNGNSIPVNLKYAIPKTEVPEELHFREYSCPLLDGYSLVSQTFSGGDILSKTYNLDSFNLTPNFFCNTNKAILNKDSSVQSIEPYMDLINTGEFKVPSGTSYTLFYVSSDVSVPSICTNVNILSSQDCFSYLDRNIDNLQLSVDEQIKLLNELNVTLDKTEILVKKLTSQIDEQIILLSSLDNTVEEQKQIIEDFEFNINEQAVYISQLSNTIEENNLLIQSLELTLVEKNNLIEQLESTVVLQKEQITTFSQYITDQAEYIKSLDLTLEKQAKYIQGLNLNIEEQSQIITILTGKTDEQAIIIQNLNLNIEEQAEVINSLTSNLMVKAKLISQLTSENGIQAELISQMKESFENQGIILQNLEKSIDDDVIMINSLTSKVDEQAEIINGLNLNIQEQSELINQLQLTLDEKIIIINNLKLTVNEQGEIISGMTSKIDEQIEIINSLNLNIQEQGEIIYTLQLTTQEQGEIISSLNLNVEKQAEIINNLKLTTNQTSALINELNLNLEQKQEIISSLNLDFEEQKLVISELNNTLEEQKEIISKLEDERAKFKKYAYTVAGISVIGAVVLVLG